MVKHECLYQYLKNMLEKEKNIVVKPLSFFVGELQNGSGIAYMLYDATALSLVWSCGIKK